MELSSWSVVPTSNDITAGLRCYAADAFAFDYPRDARMWASAMLKAADEIEHLRLIRDDLLSHLDGISRQTYEMVKSNS